MKISGFDWDEGNWPKCGKHGVSREEIEAMLLGQPAVTIGKTPAGRYVFLVFMVRKQGTTALLRPISARFMHQKEVDHHESQI